ncbi:MAG: PaaI family thioesterase [Acidimicrobiia bacterium]
MQSLQDHYAPNNRCFGCGPANDKGLRIKSFPDGDSLVAHFRPEPHHVAFGQVLNGGICGALLDCNSNWAAAYHMMQRDGTDQLPSTVTSDFHVVLKRPTPIGSIVVVQSRVVSSDGPRAVVEAYLEADGEVTATCRGTFVVVEEGHPAYHRWD